MSHTQPVLHMMCGKIAAGKSTLAARLASKCGAVLIAEDEWLNALFASELQSPKDYLRCSSKLRAILGPHISALLNTGVSVVLDFQANTVESRKWMRDIISGTEAAHQLHVLEASDELCLARLRQRNLQGEHPFAVSEEQFRRFSRYFEPPSTEEGFDLVVHNGPD